MKAEQMLWKQEVTEKLVATPMLLYLSSLVVFTHDMHTHMLWHIRGIKRNRCQALGSVTSHSLHDNPHNFQSATISVSEDHSEGLSPEAF